MVLPAYSSQSLHFNQHVNQEGSCAWNHTGGSRLFPLARNRATRDVAKTSTISTRSGIQLSRLDPRQNCHWRHSSSFQSWSIIYSSITSKTTWWFSDPLKYWKYKKKLHSRNYYCNNEKWHRQTAEAKRGTSCINLTWHSMYLKTIISVISPNSDGISSELCRNNYSFRQ